ncbi:MAG: hypothetical protein J6N45_03280 [Alphaproteobacteria bacterium]|nr:hypothetical protein [Alphaproteobacteria bacterium]
MKNRLFIFGLLIILTASGAKAHDASIEDDNMDMPKIIELPEAEDTLYGGAEVVPFSKELSVNESAQENSSDLEIIDTSDMPDSLDCSDKRLKQQMAGFIYKNINKKATNSIPEKRRRLLLARHIADFTEISEDDADLRKNVNVASALAYLKINMRRQIYKICKSSHNESNDLEDIYAIIYPFAGYYKVVAANLVEVPERLDDSTFIFSW